MTSGDAPFHSSSSDVAWTATDLSQNPHTAPDKAERVRRMFASIAGRYDLNNRLHSFGRDQAWRRRAVELCQVRATDDVLDCACGTGDLTFAFARSRPRSVTGIDFTEQMLEMARVKCAGRRTNSVVPQFVQGDVMKLGFPDNSFDVVSIAWGIRNVAEPERALREFRRVLRPGGRVCILEFSEPSNAVLRAANRIYCGRIMPWTASLIARDRSGAYRYLPKSVEGFPEPSAFAKVIERCGFPQPRLYPLTFGVCTIFLAQLPNGAA